MVDGKLATGFVPPSGRLLAEASNSERKTACEYPRDSSSGETYSEECFGAVVGEET
jgi:hypothetical protein